MIRILRGAGAAALLIVLATAGVNAGGWATVVADGATPPEPRAGDEVEYGFTVLQHGVTPAGWEEPTLRLTNAVTGESFDVAAEPRGADGHFVAHFRFPSGGSWSWSVVLRDLLVETPPVTGIVFEADGSRPVVDIGPAVNALERAKADVSSALRSELLPRIDRLERDLGGVREQIADLRAQLRDVLAERDDLAAQLAASTAAAGTSSGQLPLLGVVMLAVLGGATAGFVMAWLGQRRDRVPDRIAAAGTGRPITP